MMSTPMGLDVARAQREAIASGVAAVRTPRGILRFRRRRHEGRGHPASQASATAAASAARAG